MTEPQKISGLLSKKDLRRLTRMTREGTVGPTAVYYAGVTAPVISASVSLMVKNASAMVGFTPYWQWFVSALIAAFAGISWYLIFTRWSYRRSHGRGTETTLETEFSLLDDVLKVRRGGIETRIAWASVTAVNARRGYTSVRIEGADALIIPDTWFEGDRAARKSFVETLKQKAGS